MEPEEVKTNPIRSFTVEQGDYAVIEGLKIYNKLRSCWDFREANAYSDQPEKLQFWAVPEVMTVVQMMMAGTPDIGAPMVQKKADAVADTEVEKKRAAELRAGLEGTRRRKARFGRKRLPLIAKLDKKGYYNQFGLRDPEKVFYAMYDTDKQKFRYFKVKCLDFGSIHAVWFPVRVATINAKILNKMGIPCIVYIDDTVMILDGPLSRLQLAVAEKYYSLCGFKMSWDKRELQWLTPSLKVLGVEFERTDTEMRIQIPALKLDEANSQLDLLFEALGRRSAKLKEIEVAAGKVIFALSLSDDPDRGEARALSCWANEKAFKRELSIRGPGEMMRCIREIKLILARIRPVVLSSELIDIPVVRMTSDAASPDEPGIGGWIECGRGIVWSQFWKASRVHFWKGTRASATKSHIGIWELMAVLGNVLKFRKEIEGKKVYFYVDNLGDVFILVRACSRCRVCQAIAKLILKILRFLSTKAYFVYISTDRNASDSLTRLEKLKKLSRERKDLSWRNPPVWLTTINLIREEINSILTPVTAKEEAESGG